LINLVMTIQVTYQRNFRLYRAEIPELNISSVGTTPEEALGLATQNITALCITIEQCKDNDIPCADLTTVAGVLRERKQFD